MNLTYHIDQLNSMIFIQNTTSKSINTLKNPSKKLPSGLNSTISRWIKKSYSSLPNRLEYNTHK